MYGMLQPLSRIACSSIGAAHLGFIFVIDKPGLVVQRLFYIALTHEAYEAGPV